LLLLLGWLRCTVLLLLLGWLRFTALPLLLLVLERWTAGVLFVRLERCTAGVVFRLLVLAVTDLELLFLEEDVALSAVVLRPFAETLSCDLLEAVCA